MALQQIRPDFSGSAESMQQAQRGIAQVGTFANDWMDRLTAEQKEASRQKELQAERDYRTGRDVVADTQAKALLGIQQAAESRAVAEDAMRRGTRQAYGQADTLLGAQGLTQAQAQALGGSNTTGEGFKNKLLQEAQAIATKGYTPGSVQEKRFDTIQAELGKAATGMVNKNQSTLEGQRQLLMEQGPVREVYNVDPVTGEVVTNKDIDTTAQIALKEGRLGDIDKKIADRDKLANEWAMLKTKIGAEAAEGSKNRAATRDAREHTKAYTMITPEGRITTAYGPTERDRMQSMGYKLGENPKTDKPSAFKSIFASPILKGVEEQIGAKDAERLMSASDAVQKKYGLDPETVASIAKSSVTTSSIGASLGNNTWNPAKFQAGLAEGLAAQDIELAKTQYPRGVVPSQITQKLRDARYKEVRSTIKDYE